MAENKHGRLQGPWPILHRQTTSPTPLRKRHPNKSSLFLVDLTKRKPGTSVAYARSHPQYVGCGHAQQPLYLPTPRTQNIFAHGSYMGDKLLPFLPKHSTCRRVTANITSSRCDFSIWCQVGRESSYLAFTPGKRRSKHACFPEVMKGSVRSRCRNVVSQPMAQWTK